MSKDQSEEKSLPATKKKLRDARKKGQIAGSRDVIVAAGTSAALAYLWFDADGIRKSLQDLLTVPPELYDRPLGEAASTIATASVTSLVWILGPLFAVVAGACFLGGMVSTRGLIFAIDPITPKPDRLNPVEGFKRLFSLKSLTELLKQIVKTLLLATAVMLILRAGLPGLLHAPACGVNCLAASFGAVVKPMLGAAIALFLFAALIDIGLQQFLFGREMRMTKTEHKRERKDQEGDPLIMQARKREVKALASGAARTGIRHATVLLTSGEEHAVGLRFVRGETVVPVVVCKGAGATARTLASMARQQGTPVLDDPELAARLHARIGVGRFITEDMFNAVARVLMRVGKN